MDTLTHYRLFDDAAMVKVFIELEIELGPEDPYLREPQPQAQLPIDFNEGVESTVNLRPGKVRRRPRPPRHG